MENVINLILTALCFLVPMSIIILSAIFGTKARQKYARELQKRLDEGYYSSWGSSPVPKRFRLIAVIQIVSLLGILITVMTWLTNPSETIRITLACVFAVLVSVSVVLGIVMTRLLKK